MKLIISIDQPNITLILNRDGQIVDSLSWEDKNNLSVNLLANIEALLKRNMSAIQTVKQIEVHTDQASYTSARIAEAVAKTVELSLARET